MNLSLYLDLFVAESREHLGAAHDLASGLDGTPSSDQTLRELFRHVHSIKGMSASMGYRAMSALAHDAESLMDQLRQGESGPSAATQRILASTLSCLERMVDAAARRAAVVDDAERAPLQERLRSLLGTDADPIGDLPAFDPGGHAAPATAGRPTPAGCVKIASIIRRDLAFPAVRAAVVLGRLSKLGRIVRTEPPMAGLRTGHFDGRLLVTLVSDLSVRSLGARISAIEDVETFTLAPAEAPPEPSQTRGPVASLRVRADRLDGLLADALDLMTSLGRVHARLSDAGADLAPPELIVDARRTARRLYDGLVDVRLVPFEIAARRLERSVQELARRLGKPVRLEISGRNVRLDRSLLEGLTDPLLHMARNAIDHGIESAEERHRRRKPPEGRISVAMERRSARIALTVRDDGRGLDSGTIRREAIERGLVSPSRAVKLSESEALHLVTLPGFSTVATPNEVSGRGVGMDVVRSSVETLGGRLRIDSRPGRGARFELTFPIGVDLVAAYIVRAGGETFAVPLTALARIAVPGDQNTEWRGGRRLLSEGESEIPIERLDERLGLPRVAETAAPMVLLFSSRGGMRGIEVDALLDRREIVVRPLPAPCDKVAAYGGAACLEDGSIALLLDLPALAEE